MQDVIDISQSLALKIHPELCINLDTPSFPPPMLFEVCLSFCTYCSKKLEKQHGKPENFVPEAFMQSFWVGLFTLSKYYIREQDVLHHRLLITNFQLQSLCRWTDK